MFSYDPLWFELRKRHMTGTELREKAKFTTVTLAKINKDEYISMKVLDNICKTLNCKIENIIEYR